MADLCEKMRRGDLSRKLKRKDRGCDELRSAALQLSALLETLWCPDHWPDDLKHANNRVRRLTDNLGDLP